MKAPEFPLLFRGRPCRIWREWVNPRNPDDGYVVVQFANGGAVTVARRSELARELAGLVGTED